VFRAWQIVVACAATIFMLVQIDGNTPLFVAVPSALLIMSILAADADA